MEDTSNEVEEVAIDRIKDDMANRRTSSHVPAPLRKKKNDENYKRFITPSGNPVVYLQKHMRSKSMSDLADQERFDENQRAEINERYVEMEKLKVLLKEEEDTWTSKLQNWKSRRKSVTEDALKRKQERESLEREAEMKNAHRKTKTYREIVEEKKKRDNAMPISVEQSESVDNHSAPGKEINDTNKVTKTNFFAKNQDQVFNVPKNPPENLVEYKYTSKVTAIIGNAKSKNEPKPPKSVKPEVEQRFSAWESRNKTLPTNLVNNTGEKSEIDHEQGKNKMSVVEMQYKPPSVKPEMKVVVRAKEVGNRSPLKPRPKSAHDLLSITKSSWSKSLPRNYSTPKPFVPGSSTIAQYRKTSFANKRSMWEKISKPELKPNQVVDQQSPHLINQPITKAEATEVQSENRMGQSATLTSSGLSSISSVASKPSHVAPPVVESSKELFDDMKICINQRPRSEKGFGFTVRGGDDGKPVIVDTVCPGGAADICLLHVSDEILAINDVPLELCKTQDDIVQLIVSSVITGHLSLNIRRYGKHKKGSSPSLFAAKPVRTPLGFVQVRSDKGVVIPTHFKTPHISKFHKELSVPHPDQQVTDANNNQDFVDGTRVAVVVPKHTASQPSSSPAPSSILSYQTSLNEDKGSSSEKGDDIDEDSSGVLSSTFHQDMNHKKAMSSSEKTLGKSEFDNSTDLELFDQPEMRKEDDLWKMQLAQQQRKLQEEEEERERERKKRFEEERAEDMRVQEELERIRAGTKGGQYDRDREQSISGNRQSQSSVTSNEVPNGREGGERSIPHWMIEEAERRRFADMSGRHRVDPLGNRAKMQDSQHKGLPTHVIQHLQQQSSRTAVRPSPVVQEVLPQFWNDPSIKATLL